MQLFFAMKIRRMPQPISTEIHCRFFLFIFDITFNGYMVTPPLQVTTPAAYAILRARIVNIFTPLYVFMVALQMHTINVLIVCITIILLEPQLEYPYNLQYNCMETEEILYASKFIR